MWTSLVLSSEIRKSNFLRLAAVRDGDGQRLVARELAGLASADGQRDVRRQIELRANQNLDAAIKRRIGCGGWRVLRFAACSEAENEHSAKKRALNKLISPQERILQTGVPLGDRRAAATPRFRVDMRWTLAARKGKQCQVQGNGSSRCGSREGTSKSLSDCLIPDP